jgi:hypothetical protein
MLKNYIVRLSQEERQILQNLVSTGKAAAYKIKHANILLNIDVNGQGWTDEKAATAFSCHRNTVANLRERLVKEGIDSALNPTFRTHNCHTPNKRIYLVHKN